LCYLFVFKAFIYYFYLNIYFGNIFQNKYSMPQSRVLKAARAARPNNRGRKHHCAAADKN
jgi:hypothetical protein